MNYESTRRLESESCPGVVFELRKMSFGRRLDLLERIRGRLTRLEFLAAGERTAESEAEGAQVSAEVDREYVSWGLAKIDGLFIDGQSADADAVLSRGPEDLVVEILRAIRKMAGLDEEERKNSESHSISASETGPGGVATNAAV